MEQYVKLECQDNKNIFIPRKVAEFSPFLKEEISKILEADYLREPNETIIIKFDDIKGEIMEIVFDYINHKYYYETLKNIQDVINEDYKIDPNKALDILKATIKLKC